MDEQRAEPFAVDRRPIMSLDDAKQELFATHD
jgi:hypothetical protein